MPQKLQQFRMNIFQKKNIISSIPSGAANSLGWLYIGTYTGPSFRKPNTEFNVSELKISI